MSVADGLIIMLTFASVLVEMLGLIIVIILAIRDKKQPAAKFDTVLTVI